MRHMASIGVGNCIGGVHRSGTWPASVSATASAASIDAAPGQHRYRHRPEPWTRRMPWHGRRWRQYRRLPSMWHLTSIGVGIGGIHRCGTRPASVSSSSGILDTAHALAWPALASASTTSIDVAPSQHRHRRRRHPSMRHLASIGIVLVGNPRRGACLGMAGVGVNIDHFRTAGGVGRGETASCCVRSAGIASRRRVAVLAHLGSVDAAKSPSIVARRVASLSRRRDAAVSCRALEGPRPLSICREAGQGVPWVYPEG